MQRPLPRVVSCRVRVTLRRRSVRCESGQRVASVELRQVPYAVVVNIGPELLTMVKLLSTGVQELKSAKDDLSARLQLLESHGTPESLPNNLESNLMTSATSATRGTNENDSDRDRGNKDDSHSGHNQQKPNMCTTYIRKKQYPARLRISEAN